MQEMRRFELSAFLLGEFRPSGLQGLCSWWVLNISQMLQELGHGAWPWALMVLEASQYWLKP